MSADLPLRLRELRGLLDPLPARVPGLEAAARRLDRDLLPRTAGSTAALVVGVVGPNNAGKSTLFNALVGRPISPAMPTGGATRRLVGVAHPNLRERLESEPTLARFSLRRIEPGSELVNEALLEPDDPSELLLVDDAALPEGLLLVDTPDFDSVMVRNRDASEALLRVTDVALVVVTRHSYQNQEVVQFLIDWLAHGRPWVLVYNESIGDDTTAEHAAKLGEDVGQAPEAIFHAPHDLAVAEGRAVLAPTVLAGARPGTPPGTLLRSWLTDLPQREDLKRRALASSMGQLADEIAQGIASLDEVAARGREIEALVQQHCSALGRSVAAAAMPMGPFLAAFRAVLDRRPGWLPRGYRGFLRRGRLAVQSGWSKLWGTEPPSESKPVDRRLEQAEREALHASFARFFEDLSGALRDVDAGSFEAALRQDLVGSRLGEAEAQIDERLGADPDVARAFRESMEARIEQELDSRNDEMLLQAAVDALHILPAVAAGVVIVHTGGLGADVAVGGAGAVSTLLAERMSRLLGRPVAQAARARWIELEGARVAALARAAALPATVSMLEDEVERSAQRAEDLARMMGDCTAAARNNHE
tara:strand:+ start:1881 stop:3653 length:1773 start_codon:yes stop_codon:yes gene_type:complete